MSGAPPVRVLIAEDEANLGDLLERHLAGRGHRVTVTHNGRAALDALRAQPFDVALLDLVMPELDGLEVLRQVREGPAPPECIILAGHGTIDTAIAAMRLGAYDYVGKPYRLAEIDVLVRRAWEKRRLLADNRRLASRLRFVDGARDLTSVYAPMLSVLALARCAARGGTPVLISGEPGSGKSELARFVHWRSARAEGPLVEVACGAMAAGEAEGELFGAAGAAGAGRGSGAPGGPTGGLAELAAGGTLVLDDVGALDPAAQSALADALAHGAFRRAGARHRVELEARLVATTSMDLRAAVKGGAFRAELLTQLAQAAISLPPLRERAVDIPVLAHEFVRELGGARAPTLAAEAVEALQRYDWPGNLRELRNVLERAVLVADAGVIHARDLPLARASHDARDARTGDAPCSLAEVERRHIAAVLRSVHWHQGRAAGLLGISPKTLYRKIREYGFRRPQSPTSA